MHVAFAHIGATVKWHGGDVMTLSRVKIRGVESEGMICAQEELGLTEFPPIPEDGARPIVDLSSRNYKVGTPLRKALGQNDIVFHIDNHAITHRPDLFSQVGVARELVAMGIAKWKKEAKRPAVKFAKNAPPFTLKNDAGDLVSQYMGCMISIDGDVPTPEWMKKRLEATGWRSINLVVDITNYVLMEIGMPLHAFDADDFRGTVHIRTAKNGESITTLDDVTRKLPENAVIMSDDQGIFDLFGVMGGLRTSNKPTTKNIFLQAGIIQPSSVRRTVIAMGHRTDAATVYEKGVTLATAERGLHRAIELFMQIHPSARVASKCVTWGKMPAPKPVMVPADIAARVTGAPITVVQSKKILADLGFTVAAKGKSLVVTPPIWRTDIRIKEDIAEEVARIYGYANIKPAMPQSSITPPTRDHRINTLRDRLKEEGYFELLNLAFASPSVLKKAGFDAAKAVTIENPLGEELSRMRPSLLPAMLQMISNEIGGFDGTHLKIYEYGHIFAPKSETMKFALLVAARGKTTLSNDPVLIAKADVSRAFDLMGHALTFKQTKNNLPRYAHAGRSAEIFSQGKSVGLLTEVHPSIAAAFGLPGRTAAVLIDLDVILKTEPQIKVAAPLAQFPAVELDETFPLGKTSYASIEQRLKNIDAILRDVRIVNLYEAPDSSKTLTLRFTYRADDRTLTQQEVEKVHGKVVAELRK
jgi:phenylalanyl-tRNA synthetase beta chain